MTQAIGDEAEVVRVQPVSFTDWVAAHEAALMRFALLVVGDQAGAEDAVQEALSRAWPRWERIQRTDDPNAYVRRMVLNAHISWWRRARRREAPAPQLPEAAVAATGPEDSEALWAACLALPRRQRAVVVLRFYEGLSHAEIADLLGIAEVTARSQLHRALATLRDLLEDPMSDHDPLEDRLTGLLADRASLAEVPGGLATAARSRSRRRRGRTALAGVVVAVVVIAGASYAVGVGRSAMPPGPVARPDAVTVCGALLAHPDPDPPTLTQTQVAALADQPVVACETRVYSVANSMGEHLSAALTLSPADSRRVVRGLASAPRQGEQPCFTNGFAGTRTLILGDGTPVGLEGASCRTFQLSDGTHVASHALLGLIDHLFDAASVSRLPPELVCGERDFDPVESRAELDSLAGEPVVLCRTPEQGRYADIPPFLPAASSRLSTADAATMVHLLATSAGDISGCGADDREPATIDTVVIGGHTVDVPASACATFHIGDPRAGQSLALRAFLDAHLLVDPTRWCSATRHGTPELSYADLGQLAAGDAVLCAPSGAVRLTGEQRGRLASLLRSQPAIAGSVIIPCIPPGRGASDTRVIVSGATMRVSQVRIGTTGCPNGYDLGSDFHEITPQLRALVREIGP